jgi:hypothetical protein
MGMQDFTAILGSSLEVSPKVIDTVIIGVANSNYIGAFDHNVTG